MWLVLGHEHDACAQWLAAGLGARATCAVEWVYDRHLAQARCWSYEIAERESTLVIELADGRTIDSERTNAVVNRLVTVPRDAPLLPDAEDQDYIEQELLAFYLGWLNTFAGPILNPACPQGLGGAIRTHTDWIHRAVEAGLAVDAHFESTATPASPFSSLQAPDGRRRIELHVIDEYVVAAAPYPRAPRAICERAVALARRAGTPMLTLTFAIEGADKWVFQGANPLADVRPGGEVLVDALSQVLSEGLAA